MKKLFFSIVITYFTISLVSAQCVPTMNSIREDMSVYKILAKKLDKIRSLPDISEGKRLIEEKKLDEAEIFFNSKFNGSKNKYEIIAYSAVISYLKENYTKSVELFENSLSEFDKFKTKINEKQKYLIFNFEKDYPILVKRIEDYQAQYTTPSSHGLSYNANNQIQILNQMRAQIISLKNQLNDNEIIYPSLFRLKMGNSYMKLENFSKAEVVFQIGIKDNPKFCGNYLNLALLYHQINKIEKSKEIIEKAKLNDCEIPAKIQKILKGSQ